MPVIYILHATLHIAAKPAKRAHKHMEAQALWALRSWQSRAVYACRSPYLQSDLPSVYMHHCR